MAQTVKNPPAMQEIPVRFLGWQDLLEFAQVHVYFIGDAIQTSHPLCLLYSIIRSSQMFWTQEPLIVLKAIEDQKDLLNIYK